MSAKESMEGGMCQQQEYMEGSSGTQPAGEPQIHADKLTGPPRLATRKRITRGKRKHSHRAGWEGEWGVTV